MTLTISNAFIAEALGSLLVLAGLVFAILSAKHRGWAVIGATLIGIGGLFVVGGAGIDSPDGPSPPTPTPPGPNPAPVTSFQQDVLRSFTGTKEEANNIADVFADYAFALAFDGTRQSPRVTNTQGVVVSMQEAQRYAMGQESPFTKFRETSRVIESELKKIEPGPLDSSKRASVVNVLVDASEALEAVK